MLFNIRGKQFSPEDYVDSEFNEEEFHQYVEQNKAPNNLLQDAIYAWRNIRYGNVSWQAKATAALAIAYLMCPVDAIPDIIPILGWTDDAAVLTFALKQIARG